MYWRFGYQQQVPSIDSILDRSDVTLEEILSEEDVLQEVKTRHRKLLDFFLKPDIFAQLVQWVVREFPSAQQRQQQQLHEKLMEERLEVTQDGDNAKTLADLSPATDDKTRGFPFLVTEILSCDVAELSDTLINSPTLMDTLLDLLNRPHLSSIHASFLSKILGCLLARNANEVVSRLRARPQFLRSLLNHLETAAVVDILLKLFITDDLHDDDQVCRWMSEEHLIAQMIDRLDPNCDEATHSTAAQTIIDMIAALHQSANPDPNILNFNSLIKELKSAEMMNRLLNLIFQRQAPNAVSTLIHGISIIIELIRRGTCADEYDVPAPPADFAEAAISNLPPPPPAVHRDPLVIDEVINTLIGRIGEFKEALVHPRSSVAPLPTTTGFAEPLGSERLNITELFAELLRTQRSEVFQQFLHHKVLNVCFDLFFRFEWNNLLHMVVCDMVNTVFDSPIDDTKDLILSMFTDIQITHRITEAVRLNHSRTEQPRGFRLGYMGHVTLIADKILVMDASYGNIQTVIQPYLVEEQWQEYVSRVHRETKDRDRRALGGQKPVWNAESRPDTGGADNGNYVDLATDQLARYLVQYVVRDVPDLFAVASEDEHGWSGAGSMTRHFPFEGSNDVREDTATHCHVDESLVAVSNMTEDDEDDSDKSDRWTQDDASTAGASLHGPDEDGSPSMNRSLTSPEPTLPGTKLLSLVSSTFGGGRNSPRPMEIVCEPNQARSVPVPTSSPIPPHIQAKVNRPADDGKCNGDADKDRGDGNADRRLSDSEDGAQSAHSSDGGDMSSALSATSDGDQGFMTTESSTTELSATASSSAEWTDFSLFDKMNLKTDTEAREATTPAQDSEKR